MSVKIFVDILSLLGKCGRNFSKARFTDSKMSMKIFIDVEVKDVEFRQRFIFNTKLYLVKSKSLFASLLEIW